MRKRVFGIILCVLLLCTSCKANPETDIVQSREEEQYAAEPLEKSENAAVLQKVSERLTKNVQAYDGKVILNVDAEIIVPQRETWPVYRTRLTKFSEDEIKGYAQKLFGENATLKYQKTISTKSDLMRDIQEYCADIEEIENGSDAYEGGIEHYRELIENAKKEMEDAPEKADYPDFKWDEIGDKDAYGFFAELGASENPWMHIENNLSWGSYFTYANTKMPGLEHVPWCEDYGDVYSSDDYTKTIAKDIATATKEAEAFIDDLGIEDMAAEGSVTMFGNSTTDLFTYDFCAYGIVFTRLYNGIPETYMPERGVLMEAMDGTEYAVSRESEHLIVVVDDSGAVQMRWTAPEKITEVENENVRLVEFADIDRAMETALKVKYAYVEENSENMPPEEAAEFKPVELNITKIRLSYVTIHIPSNPDEFRAVPAWIFYDDSGEAMLAINATDMSNV